MYIATIYHLKHEMLHWIGNNYPMWIDWTLNTHLMCSYLLAVFTGKRYVRKFSSSSHLKKKVNFCMYVTRKWNPLPLPMYILVFDLLVRVANVFLELFPLKAEHYVYHNIVSSVRSSYSPPDLLLITTGPLFQITPVLNTGLSLSEPLQLYKGYNAI